METDRYSDGGRLGCCAHCRNDLICDRNGMLAGYSPKGIDRIRKGFRDEKNAKAHWVGIKAWETGVVSNTVELGKLGIPAPTSYADLIKPEYKGRIVMPNPASSGTGFLAVSAILQLMGEQKGWEYLDRLHINIAQYTHSGSKPAKMAGKGEFPVGISFGYRGFKQKAAGEPVAVAFPKEGAGWDLEANALVRKPKINPAARTFLDWAISDDAMKMYSKVYPTVAVDMDVDVPEGYPKDARKVLIKNDFEWAARNRDRILTEWSRRYDGKSEAKN
jgi:iron(III) transport system substrate-binding protein